MGKKKDAANETVFERPKMTAADWEKKFYY